MYYKEGVMRLDFLLNWLLVHVHKALRSLLHITEANFRGNIIKGVGFELFLDDKSTALIQNIVLSEKSLTHVAVISSDPVFLK